MADQETRPLWRFPRCHHLLLLVTVIGFCLLGLWRQHRRVERLDVTSDEVSRMCSRDAILIINPNARRVAADLNRARAELARSGINVVEEIPIEDTDLLQKHLSKSPPYLVIAAGGDGTVSWVANKVAKSRMTMAILPLGTANDFARSLGIPVDIIKAIRLIAEGKESSVDLGQLLAQGLPPRYFVHAATVGVNAGFANLATWAPLRHRLGRLTYLVSGATALWGRRPFQCRLTFDGQAEGLELLQLSIFNAPVFGGFLGLRVQGSKLDNHTLDVVAVENIPLRKLALVGVLYILRYQQQIPGIHIFHTGHIHVQACQQLEVTLDGELAGYLPAEFKVAGEALRVITSLDFEDAKD